MKTLTGTKEKSRFRGGTLRVRKKHLAVLGGLLAAAAIFGAVFSPRIVGASATTRRLPIYCVARDDKACSLTFDAAWGNEDTQQLIDILERYKVKATFFVVGEWVDKYPESVKALSDAGHEVMNHSNDHAHFSQLSAEQIVANINACSDKIESVTGIRPTLFRAPYGEYDDKVIAAVDGMGVKTIQWDVETLATVGTPHGAGIFLYGKARRRTLRALPYIGIWSASVFFDDVIRCQL